MTTSHLDKARTALEHAADLDVDLTLSSLPPAYMRLLDLAAIQASLAQAEALTRIADALDQRRRQESERLMIQRTKP